MWCFGKFGCFIWIHFKYFWSLNGSGNPLSVSKFASVLRMWHFLSSFWSYGCQHWHTWWFILAPQSCDRIRRVSLLQCRCVIHSTDTSAQKWIELFVFNNARTEGCTGRGVGCGEGKSLQTPSSLHHALDLTPAFATEINYRVIRKYSQWRRLDNWDVAAIMDLQQSTLGPPFAFRTAFISFFLTCSTKIWENSSETLVHIDML